MRCYQCGRVFGRNEQVYQREVETGHSRYQSYYSLRSMILSPLSRRTYYRLVNLCGQCANQVDEDDAGVSGRRGHPTFLIVMLVLGPVALIGLLGCLFFGLLVNPRLRPVPATSGPAVAQPEALPQALPRPADAGPKRSKPTVVGQNTPDLLPLTKKGTSDEMEIEVVDVAKNKWGKVEITVRITNRSQTLRKRPYFYFSVFDDFGNDYGVVQGNANASLYPGKSLDERHSFDMPVEKAEYVILAVSNRDGRHFDVTRFKVPSSMWTVGAK